jgi:hypothetical protein
MIDRVEGTTWKKILSNAAAKIICDCVLSTIRSERKAKENEPEYKYP